MVNILNIFFHAAQPSSMQSSDKIQWDLKSLVVSKPEKSESEDLDKSYSSPCILDPVLEIQAPLPSTSTPKV